ncbi:DUF5011 domain-containing protein [Hyalangium minutum]|uniref:Pesticidal crystal protein Cry22Aa Ig-like domain-containing protein n=1 Tax=Hyalangium minutum TaxID=394096 RepID=A0A085W4D5_9BACT|nr:DUF5011 domain-containing protein [Hyalangium minutum]KFE62548.1 hypothetical protein DB31_3982 [Hyalangium minutum]
MRINETWKVLISTLGLSLVGCGGAALEGEELLARKGQSLDGAVTVTLNGAAELTLECGVDSWSDPGATATDAEGNPLPVITYNSGNDEYGPGPNASAEGIYYVQYAAHDEAWNSADVIRTVNVQDTQTPTLTLNGDADITHACGTNFEDPGFTASDVCYGDLTSEVVQTGYVNGWVEGTYTLLYELSDGAGHTAPALTRTVNVVDCPWNR